jgi:hypothetical protein
MKCPKCDHENSSEDLVRNIAECPCDCHKETHSFLYLRSWDAVVTRSHSPPSKKMVLFN